MVGVVVKVSAVGAEKACMVDPRCPKCSARVPADADWCSLCYASLRVQPAPAPLVQQPAYASSATFDPLTAPSSALAELSELAAEEPEPVPVGRHARRQAAARAAAQATAQQAAQSGPRTASWPCRKCTAQVAMDQDMCPVCGGGFLDASEISLRLPLIGDAKELSGGKKVWVIIAGSTAIVVAFLAVAMIVGLVS